MRGSKVSRLSAAFLRLLGAAVFVFALITSVMSQGGSSVVSSKEGRIIDVPRENIELLDPIPIVAGLPFLPYATGLKEPSDVVLGYRPEVADPTAFYDNFSTTSYSGVVNSNGGQAGGVTRLVADDLTLVGTAPYNLGSFLWVVCSTNTGSVTVRSLIRFYADNGGVPGNLIAGYNLPAFIPLNNSICQPIQVRLTPELQIAISTNKIWAGTSFDRAEGASATEAQMNNIGGGFFNPPELGSSADLFFRTTNAGDFFSSNPPGTVMTVAGSPVDNFGWDLRRRVRLNPIARLDADPRTPNSTARWSITLNTSDPADGTQLTGLAPSHFTLARTGSVTGSVTSVVQNGTGNNSFTVTATLGAGTGTVGLSLTDNQTNLNTGIANAFPVVGEVYNVVGGASPTPTPTATPIPTPTPTPILTPTPTPTPTPMVTPTPTPTPGGSSLVVNKTADTNDGSCTVADCSLREAVTASNAAAGTDTITFDPTVFSTPQTITLTNGNIVFANSVNSNVTITGPGSNLLTINGNNQSKVFTITETPVVNISGMTLTGGNGVGNSPGNTFGGAVYNQGVLTLTNMVITGNSAGTDGGGVYNSTTDSLTLIGCTITNNTAASQSGGVHNHTDGTLTISDSTISNNVANAPAGVGVGGGAIYSEDGSNLSLTNSTISNNRATSSGGGIVADSVILTVTNSTISGNSSTGRFGGGIALDIDTTATITGSTISGNTAATTGGGLNIEADTNNLITITNSTISGNSAPNGGGIFRDVGASLTVTLSHTTIAGNSATVVGGGINGTMNLGNSLVANNIAPTGPDHGGTLNSNGFNLVENTAGTTFTGTTASNITGQDPILGPLLNNGGRTFTHALLPGSPAIDKGASGSLTVDQRQVIRPIDNVNVTNIAGGNGSDIGAFEAGYTISGRTFTPNGQAIRNGTVSLFNGQNVRIMTSTTSSFGIYNFTNVIPGQYTVTVSNKRFRFSPIVRQINADLTNLDIFGLE